jgi:sterol desaturase/sphingolipid hydroxylase (fatty acid hydroxylase superfamily)
MLHVDSHAPYLYELGSDTISVNLHHLHHLYDITKKAYGNTLLTCNVHT